MSTPRQGLTRFQRYVLRELERGAAIWEVDSGNDDGEYRVPSHFVLAMFDGDEFLGTQPLRLTTLLELRRRDLVDLELP